MNKKGMAQIIATIVLVVFAVIIGVVMMSFGRAQVEEQETCPVNIGFAFVKDDAGADKICYNEATKQINFVVQNGINIRINSLLVTVISENGAESFDLKNSLIKRALTFEGNVDYNFSLKGKIEQVLITPQIVLFNQEQSCARTSLIAQEIGSC